jgi:hypothetical protein
VQAAQVILQPVTERFRCFRPVAGFDTQFQGFVGRSIQLDQVEIAAAELDELGVRRGTAGAEGGRGRREGRG